MPDNYKGPAQFLSTPSARRATGLLTEDDIAEVISIHALREEGDHVQSFAGEGIEGFLSTPSARRATGIGYVIQRPSIISIHALREEGDLRLLYIQLSFWISIHALREEGDLAKVPDGDRH